MVDDKPRRALVAKVQSRLQAVGYPRLTVLAAMIASGSTAALFSMATLHAGLRSMPVRYGIAVLVGYATFVSCIRLWIAYERWRTGQQAPVSELRRSNRSSSGSGFDVGDIVSGIDLPSARGTVQGAANLFAGGTSGGGGGGAEWAMAMPPMPAETTGSSAGDTVSSAAGDLLSGFDSDELMWLLLALAAVLGGLVAVCWVIYVAPVMLAEVALDAALVGTAYRRIKNQDLESWTTAVIRRTWLPALALAGMMVLAGWAFEHAAPGAHSIGAVVHHFVQ
jgi:hypothetical protein